MSWLYIALGVVAALFAIAIVLYAVSRRLQRREPYASFMRLRSRHKLRFFQMLATDSRVPRRVRALPWLLALYLAMPFDLIPDFIPVLGYVDDVAIILATLALVIRLTPPGVMAELLTEA